MKFLVGVALFLVGTDAVQGLSFLKQKRFNKQRHFMSSRDLARPGKEYGGPVEACCGCVKARSLAKTDGQTRECGTCYTADTWQVSGAEEGTTEIGGRRATSFKVLPYIGGEGRLAFRTDITEEDECKKFASANSLWGGLKLNYWGIWARGCIAFFGHFVAQDYVTEAQDVEAYWNQKSMELAAKYAPLRIGEMGEDLSMDIPPLIEVYSGKEAEMGYEVITSSAKESINQWHWTCADGNAPQDDLSQWQNPFVEGEPPSRSLYKLCREPKGVSREDMERACDEFLNPSEEGQDADKAMANAGKMPVPIVPWKIQ